MNHGAPQFVEGVIGGLATALGLLSTSILYYEFAYHPLLAVAIGFTVIPVAAVVAIVFLAGWSQVMAWIALLLIKFMSGAYESWKEGRE